jgi:hypothetical protein
MLVLQVQVSVTEQIPSADAENSLAAHYYEAVQELKRMQLNSAVH